MSKSVAYHEAVVDYNRQFAEFAEGIVDGVSDSTVKKWCVGIAKQHRAHERRHQKILDRMAGFGPAGSVFDAPEEPETSVDSELSTDAVRRLDAITEEVNA